ncbi:MAG TPA: PEP-CTERM sorting domain-containing protein [Burkholderiaceae bacterium]|jgi:hypothetical protein
MRIRLFALSALALAAMSAHASVSINAASDTYAQNFDTLSANAPRGALFGNDSTLNGWSIYKSDATAGAFYYTDDGSGLFGSASGFHSLGTGGSSDRALGVLPSADSTFGNPAPAAGSPAGWVALSATNNSGAALSAFTLGYAGELWRQNDGSPSSTLTVQYGFGSSFAGVTSWTHAGAGFDFSTPSMATAGAVNGNTVGHVAGLGGTVGGLNWNNGDTLWIRWEATAVTGGNTMGIDDVSLSVSAVPEPSSIALMLAGIGAVGFMVRRRKV